MFKKLLLSILVIHLWYPFVLSGDNNISGVADCLLAFNIFTQLPAGTFVDGFITQPQMTASLDGNAVTNDLVITYNRDNFDPNKPLSAFTIMWHDGTNSVPVNMDFFEKSKQRKDGDLNDGGPIVTNVDCNLNRLIDVGTDTEYYWDRMNKLRDKVTSAEGLAEEVVTRVKRACSYAYKIRWDVCNDVLKKTLNGAVVMSRKPKESYSNFVRRHVSNFGKIKEMLDHINTGFLVLTTKYSPLSDIPGQQYLLPDRASVNEKIPTDVCYHVQ